MSYQTVHRCFGYLLFGDGDSDARMTENLTPFFWDLWRHLDRRAPSSVDDEFGVEDVADMVAAAPWGFGIFNDGDDSAVGIGFKVDRWAAWELRGPNGIITTAQTPPTPEQLASWMDKWRSQTVPIRHLLEKHGIEPGIIWAAGVT